MAAAATAPSPRSPPRYPDLCGRRRLQLEVQVLSREIGFLEDELLEIEGLQSVSRCCKEINEFVGTKTDPLIPVKKKKRHRSCRFWNWICKRLCCNLSWICCFSECLLPLEFPSCSCLSPKDCSCFHCNCTCPTCCSCDNSCSRPHCCQFSCLRFNCRKLSCCKPRCKGAFCCLSSCCKVSCHWPHCPKCISELCGCWKQLCCTLPSIRFPECSCGCIWSCPKCPNCSRSCLCSQSASNTCCISGCQC